MADTGTVLINIVPFTGLVVGVPTTLPHVLNVNGAPLTPQLVLPRKGGFDVGVNATDVTVTRLAGAADAVDVYLEFRHSMYDVTPPDIAPHQPFIADPTSGSASSDTIGWKPSGGSDARTWAEVMALVSAAYTPVTIVVLEDAVIDVPGTYDMRNSTFSGFSLSVEVKVTLQDGVVLHNLGGLSLNVTVEGNSTTPCLSLDFPPGKPAAYRTEFGAHFINQSTTSVMIEVPDGQFMLLLSNNTSGWQDGDPGSMAFASLGAGASFVRVFEGFTTDAGENLVTGGDGASNLLYVPFGRPGPYPTPPGFLGNVFNTAMTTVGGSGPTSQRPAPAFGPIPMGCMYFDTDLGQPIWWNGSAWINAAGPTPPAPNLFATVTGEAIPAGSPVDMGNLFGAPTSFMSNATVLGNCIGLAATAAGLGDPLNVVLSGPVAVPDAIWVVVPTPADVGLPVFVDETAGLLTLDTTAFAIPSQVQCVGTVAVGGAGSVVVLVAVGTALAIPRLQDMIRRL